MNTNINIIAASILSANLAKLGEEVTNVLAAGADWIHFDVMDNHYVPNLTFGASICKALRTYGITAPIDVHLMVKPIDELIIAFAKAGGTYITFHPDASNDIVNSINLIKKHNCYAGLALNPEIPISNIEHLIEQLDMVLLMSVNPGFAGQEFIPSVLPKIKQLQQIVKKQNLKLKIAVDGGINLNNISDIAQAGANVFIAGSTIFGACNYNKIITAMKTKINQY